MIAEKSLTLDGASVTILEPFFIFEFQEFFEREIYEKLDELFPTKSKFPKKWSNRGGKYYLQNKMPEFSDFVKEAPIWSELYDRFSDPSVVAQFCKLTHSVPSERPAHETRPWRLTSASRSKSFVRERAAELRRFMANLQGRTPVYLTFEFSYLDSGCYIPPHTDAVGKLISLMIYFPDEVEYPAAAGTEFYRGKGGAAAQNAWKSGMLEDDAMREFFANHETLYTSAFSANKLVGFVKSSQSWHGVQHLTLPPNATRRSLNVNYYLA